MTPGGLLVRRQFELPTPPVEIADEVELYARQSGRHARLHFFPTYFERGRVKSGTWVVRMTLKRDDKRLSLYQEGKVDEEPTEDVWLHVPDPQAPGGYKPLNLVQLGASGVRAFLEKGNMWSGRGEFASLDEQVRKIRQGNAESRERIRQEHREANRHEQRDKRRWRFKIPFLSVGVDLKSMNGQEKPVRPDAPSVAPQQET